MIKRPSAIELEYSDAENERHTIQLEGLGSRCVQHELDHLNGIIFLQRASKLKLERAIKARPKERRKRLDHEKRMEIVRRLQDIQSQSDSDADEGRVSDADKVAQQS
tara:strand:- start:1332 stop:1652 length:321 start_codon:yes stop_codon:yes gene_type:complete